MVESSPNVDSVIFVCRSEAVRLRHLSRELEHAEPRRIEGALRDIAKCADTLSAALTRASAFADYIDHDGSDAPLAEPLSDDAGAFEIAKRLHASAKFGFCVVCGGVQRQRNKRTGKATGPDASPGFTE